MNEVVIKVIGNYSYQTSRCLGEGVYGKVFEGMERETKEKVAIKKIDLATFTNDKYLENAIFSEIYLLKRFNHPNIVRFKDVLSSKNSLYIITEFCKNGDLKQLINKKKFKEEEAFEIMRQILSGFTELVKEKIIHRDLKPANILIHEGTYKIGDFGFAKYVDNFGSQMLKSCVGSPIYMAPQILERTQYTTKCDIWSLGVIFYEMIHTYPPWKARDQPELLRGIKGIPITQVLKRSSLSARGNEFLKKTLAYSEEQRIGWAELFENFGPPKAEKLMAESVESKPVQKERHRVISANSSSNINKWGQQNSISNKNSLTPNAFTTNTSSNNGSANNSYKGMSYSPEKKRNLYQPSTPTISTEIQQLHSPSTQSLQQNSQQQLYTSPSSNNNEIHSPTVPQSVPNFDSKKKPSSSSSNQSQQLETITNWRSYLIYYHFYTIELMMNYETVGRAMHKSELLGKLLFTASLVTKNRSTFYMSMMTTYLKQNKSTANDDFLKKMQREHESYEMVHNDVKSMLERHNMEKNIRTEMVTAIGMIDVINEDRMLKLEQYMVSLANQAAQILSEEVRKRAKSSKQLVIVEALDRVVDILGLGLNKGKAVKPLGRSERSEDEDLKDYISRVILKVDQLTANI